jgi:hypothetical protein
MHECSLWDTEKDKQRWPGNGLRMSMDYTRYYHFLRRMTDLTIYAAKGFHTPDHLYDECARTACWSLSLVLLHHRPSEQRGTSRGWSGVLLVVFSVQRRASVIPLTLWDQAAISPSKFEGLRLVAVTLLPMPHVPTCSYVFKSLSFFLFCLCEWHIWCISKLQNAI